MKEYKENKLRILLSCAISIALGIGVVFLCFEEWRIFNNFLLGLFSNGINPTLVVLGFTILWVIVSLCLLIKFYDNIDYLFLYSGLFLMAVGITNICLWANHDFKINTNVLKLPQKQKYEILLAEKEGYVFLGEVRGYQKSDEDVKKTFNLFTKIVDGRKFYYCSLKPIYQYSTVDDQHLIQKYDDKGKTLVDGKWYIIRFNFDWDHLYVSKGNSVEPKRKVSQESIEQAVNVVNSNKSTENKIVVENVRQPQPIQEWIPCMTCKGSRNCTVCGGSGWLYNSHSITNKEDCYNCNGRKNCPACGGQGGHYETVYR